MGPDELLPLTFGWYGKLPTRGDFVGRGLPREWLRIWDDWLQRSLAGAGVRLGATALREKLLAMPPWQCVVVPRECSLPVWCGVVVPSTDRVGRAFPLLLAEAYDPIALDRAGLVQLQARALCLADWLDRIGALSTPRSFELGAKKLAGTAWRCKPDTVSMQSVDVVGNLPHSSSADASFWWRPEPVGAMHAALTEGWPPRESLMFDWIGVAA